MDWQTFLSQLNAEYHDIGKENPPVEVYDANTGDRYSLVTIYNEEGILCLDVERQAPA